MIIKIALVCLLFSSTSFAQKTKHKTFTPEELKELAVEDTEVTRDYKKSCQRILCTTTK